MSQTGLTPILIYASGTATNVPSAANLTSNSSGAELALNYADGKLYYKDNLGSVQLLASKAGASGSVTSVDVSGGSTGLTTSGGPVTTSGTITLAGILAGANGGTGVNNGSKTITIGGNVTLSGAYTFTGTLSNNTSVTFPTAGTLATLAGSETLTNKTISGASNTLSNIDNASLTNSSVTLNGTSVSLGGSATITAAAPNALTIGTGLSGTSYNGSSAVTITIDSTVATLTGSQTLTNKTISGANNTLSNIGNASLTNSAVTVNGTSISLGGSGTVTANTTNALTIGTGLSGTSFNGSGAVTIAIDSTVATLTGAQTLTNKRIDPRVYSTASASSVTPDISSYDAYYYTALATGLTINATTGGSPVNGDMMLFRFKDNGSAQTLTWTTAGTNSFRVIGVTLPTTTTAGKVTYVGCIYNSDESYWDVVAVTTQA